MNHSGQVPQGNPQPVDVDNPTNTEPAPKPKYLPDWRRRELLDRIAEGKRRFETRHQPPKQEDHEVHSNPK